MRGSFASSQRAITQQAQLRACLRFTNSRAERAGARRLPARAGKGAKQAAEPDAYDTVEITTPASKASPHSASTSNHSDDGASKAAASNEPDSDSDESSSASRLMKLARGPNASKDNERPAYRPQSASFLARRRMLLKMLPYEWQKGARSAAEAIPEESFSYILSTLSIALSALIGGSIAYFAEPTLKEWIIQLFHADAPEARVAQELTFETQYLAAISFLTAVLFGNTFGLCFDGQRQIVSAMAKEVFALELLLQELFIQIPEPNLRWRVIKHIRRYTDEEIQARDIDSPFRVDGAVVSLFNALLTLREKENKNVSKMISSVEMLAESNSERGALSSQLLPALHWVLLTALSGLILVAFLLYDSNFSGKVEENRIIFAVLAAAFVSVLRVLQDISDADGGLYSVRDPIDNRLTFVRWQMDNILADPTIKLSILGNQENDGSDEEQDSDGVWKPESASSGREAQVAGVTAAGTGGQSGATSGASSSKR